MTITRAINFVAIPSSENIDSKANSILDRFCFDIIPQIQHNIECLTLDPLSIDRILCIGHYSKLHQLTLMNLQREMASHIFDSKLSALSIVK